MLEQVAARSEARQKHPLGPIAHPITQQREKPAHAKDSHLPTSPNQNHRAAASIAEGDHCSFSHREWHQFQRSAGGNAVGRAGEVREYG